MSKSVEMTMDPQERGACEVQVMQPHSRLGACNYATLADLALVSHTRCKSSRVARMGSFLIW